ncbi:hypothetical protein [Bradyrhizobium sp. BR 10261]|uniref:hypothetical protein n=1 Tax=Bradyrhizobium sp. BR 10261 TaxID=2749992 RepID=UPI001C649418|nr:hypothetical protein [Bradyrhizobium sp. BR 10261]MBW7961932.1 hypothetical protein [Bradyrhizobium sp. BR 10261]
MNVVFKALRCEIITFLEANRMRRAQFARALKDYGYETAIEHYSFIDLDETKFGALQVDLKTIDTVGLTLGVDWKASSVPSGNSETWHLGPSYTGFKTYTRTTTFALPQDAKLGPSKRNKRPAANLAGGVGDEDAGFFCYLEPQTPTPLIRTLADVELLVAHQVPEVEKFDRIYVDGKATLAQWLEITISREMAKSWLAKGDYMEAVYAGQLQYSFALDIKPGIDLKYTLVASTISPLVPDLSASRENSGTFTLDLNTLHVVAAAGARNGSAIIASDIGPPPAPVAFQVWGPPTTPPPGSHAPVPRQPAPGAGGAAAPSPRRGPGVRLEYPLPLPSLVSPANP